ncbi:hypothetical protein OU994_19965 [Pseudoduganella sp. SL102]|uniref:hypothetical protein n=1 Tax=Pseudoduganella sp. SL102 TaxID=2995154 RepID=UPI00248B4678|nr:hypothetical protein [Pseudoduganella sp. SL102]WBS00584.1 hypothetical protein OU994_19965 [Pseudoduganella sp. SL102]
MHARVVFAVLALAFLAAAAVRLLRDGGLRPASKTWLLVAALFGATSAWLWLQ